MSKRRLTFSLIRGIENIPSSLTYSTNRNFEFLLRNLFSFVVKMSRKPQICPEMQVNEMHAFYDKHHSVLFPKKSPKHT